jgi:hypothetical protein
MRTMVKETKSGIKEVKLRKHKLGDKVKKK